MNNSSLMTASFYEAYLPSFIKDKLSTEKENFSVPNNDEIFSVLLFADISGFTKLSSKLSVEELKLTINDYFTRLINIVQSYNGDIVKFCGDALVIMWQAPLLTHAGEKKAMNLKAALCALQLIDDCGSYSKQSYGGKAGGGGSSTENMIVQTMSHIFTDSNLDNSPDRLDTASAKQEPIELSLHCGMVCGKVNAMILGNETRKEFLLAGGILSELAEAATIAKKSELCVHRSCYYYLKKYLHFTVIQQTPQTAVLAPEVKKSAFIISDPVSPFDSLTVTNDKIDERTDEDCTSSDDSSAKVEEPAATANTPKVNPKESTQVDFFLLFGDFSEDFKAYLLDKGVISAIAVAATTEINRKPSMGCKTPRPRSLSRRLSDMINLTATTAPAIPANEEETSVNQKKLFRTRHRSSFASTISDISSRLFSNPDLKSSFSLVDNNQTNNPGPVSFSSRLFGQRLSAMQIRKPSLNLSETRSRLYTVSEMMNIFSRCGDPTIASIFDSQLPENKQTTAAPVQPLTDQDSEHYLTSIRSFVHETALKAIDGNTYNLLSEVREVVTVFLLIDGLEKDFHHGQVQRPQEVFLLLLHQISVTGGSLRQFVIDDKGCVAIVCYGLYGSSNRNNSVQAVKLALALSQQLFYQYHCVTSIGITSGSAYCGNVGSEKRCEFVVMGASVNLAARLMASAHRTYHNLALCSSLSSHGNSQSYQTLIPSIYVDSVVRSHAMNKLQFQQTMSIQAKGYDQPIQVYTVIPPSSSMTASRNAASPAVAVAAKLKVMDLESDNGSVQTSNQVEEEEEAEAEPERYFSQEIEKQLVDILDMMIQPEFLPPHQVFGSVVITGAEHCGKSTLLHRIQRSLKDAALHSEAGRNVRSLLISFNPHPDSPRPSKVMNSNTTTATSEGMAYSGIQKILRGFFQLAERSSATTSQQPLLPASGKVDPMLDDSGKLRLLFHTKHTLVLSEKQPSVRHMTTSEAAVATPVFNKAQSCFMKPEESQNVKKAESLAFPQLQLAWMNQYLSWSLTLAEMVAFCYGYDQVEVKLPQILHNFEVYREESKRAKVIDISATTPLRLLLSLIIPSLDLSDLAQQPELVLTAEDLLLLFSNAKCAVHAITDLVWQYLLLVLQGYSPYILQQLSLLLTKGVEPTEQEEEDNDYPTLDLARLESYSLSLLLDDLQECDLPSIRVIYFLVDWISEKKKYGLAGGLILMTWTEAKEDLLLLQQQQQQASSQRIHSSRTLSQPSSAITSAPSPTAAAAPVLPKLTKPNRRDLSGGTGNNPSQPVSALATHFMFKVLQYQSRARRDSQAQQRYRLVREYLMCIKYFSLLVSLEQYSATSVRTLLYRNLGRKRWEWLLQKHESDLVGQPTFGRRRSVVDGIRRNSYQGGSLPKIVETPPGAASTTASNNTKQQQQLSTAASCSNGGGTNRPRKGSELIVKRVVENTNGLPALVYELIATLKNSIDHGTYEASHELPILKQQNHMKTLELLDSLNGSELAIIKAASVIGSTFPLPLLCEGLISLNMDYCCADLILTSALHRLEKIGVIHRQGVSHPFFFSNTGRRASTSSSLTAGGLRRPSSIQLLDSEGSSGCGGGEENYCFIDETVRLSIYNLLLESQRNAIHAAIANYFESHHCITMQQIDTRTVYQHFMRSGLTDKMTEYSYHMMEEAQNCRNYYEAIQHCSTFIGLAAGLSTKVILKTILEECVERYHHLAGVLAGVNKPAAIIVGKKRLLSSTATVRDLQDSCRCLPTPPPTTTASKTISLTQKKSTAQLLDHLVELTKIPATSLTASGVAAAGGERSFSTHVMKRRGTTTHRRGSVQHLLNSSLRLFSHPRKPSCVASYALEDSSYHQEEGSRSLYGFYPLPHTALDSTPEMSLDRAGAATGGRGLRNRSHSVYLRNGKQQIKLTGQRQLLSYHNRLAKVFHYNALQEYYQVSALAAKTSSFWRGRGSRDPTAKLWKDYLPSDSYSKKILKISNLSHVILGMERMSSLYFCLGHCGKAEDYAVAALSLYQNFYSAKAIESSVAETNPAKVLAEPNKPGVIKSPQAPSGGFRRRSSSSIRGGGTRKRSSSSSIKLLLRNSRRESYQRLLQAGNNNHDNINSNPDNSLVREVEQRCIRNLGLFACLRGDLIAALTLFSQYPTTRNHGQKKEDNMILLAIQSYLYRLSNDFLSSLQCIQAMILSPSSQIVSESPGLALEKDYHFTTELKGLLFFLLGSHYLSDGHYQQSERMYNLALQYYSVLQNYSMQTILLVLMGWSKVYQGESEGEGGGGEEEEDGIERIDDWLVETAPFPIQSMKSLSNSASWTSQTENDKVNQPIADKNKKNNNNNRPEKGNQKSPAIKSDDTIPKPFQSDLFLLQSHLASQQRIQRHLSLSPTTSTTSNSYYSDLQVQEMAYSSSLAAEKTVISTNYLTGFTGNAYWAFRTQQLWELLLTSPTQLGLVTVEEWQELFWEYFHGNPLDTVEGSIATLGFTKQAKDGRNVLAMISSLLVENSTSSTDINNSRLNKEEVEVSTTAAHHESHYHHSLSSDSSDSPILAIPPAVVYATSPIHVRHYLYLCCSCLERLQQTQTSPLATAVIQEWIVYLWLSIAHLKELTEMTFPAMRSFLQVLIYRFQSYLLQDYLPRIMSSSSNNNSPGMKLVVYLDQHIYPLLLSFDHWERGIVKNQTRYLQQLVAEMSRFYEQVAPSSNAIASNSTSNSNNNTVYSSMISDLFTNFLELHCLKHDSIVASSLSSTKSLSLHKESEKKQSQRSGLSKGVLRLLERTLHDLQPNKCN